MSDFVKCLEQGWYMVTVPQNLLLFLLLLSLLAWPLPSPSPSPSSFQRVPHVWQLSGLASSFRLAGQPLCGR